MKGLYSNPNIAPHIKESLLAYLEHDSLDRFYTSYYYRENSKINQLVSKYFPSINQKLKSRFVEAIPSAYIKSRPVPELMRVFSAQKLNGTITDKIWEWGELGFDQWVAKRVTKNVDWVHTSEHAGLNTLQAARKLGIMSIHEQPSLHHRFFSEIIKRQTSLHPEFEMGTAKLLVDENSVRRNLRRDEELKIADVILCNSRFTKKTLVNAGIDESKVLTIPLGFPAVETSGLKAENTKLKFMYAGNISFGKGIHLLLDAWREIHSDNTELWLIGNINLPKSVLTGLPDSVKVLPRIPHAELMKIYHQVDVFVHPTLADGFGMVIAEAMSRGLPVITTHNSGGADLIDEGENGMVIHPESKESIINALKWCIENKYKLIEMGRSAQHKASTYPWSEYRKQLLKEITYRRTAWEQARKFA